MNSSESRVEIGVFKQPALLREHVDRVARVTHRSKSAVLYYLVLRGLEAFEKDGQLFHGEDELAFLRKIGSKKGRG